MPNPDTSGRQILGGSSRENGMSPLPKQNKVFLVRAARPGSYWRVLVPASLWSSTTHPSPWHCQHWCGGSSGPARCASCPERERPARAAAERAWPPPWASSMALPCAPWSSMRYRPELMGVVVSSLIDGLRIFIPVLICFSMVVRSLSSLKG